MLARFTINSVIDNLDDFGAPMGEPEINDTTAVGEVTNEGGVTTLFYKEKNEDTVTSTRIEMRADGSVFLRRMGGIASDMLFIEGKETKTLYQIPPYIHSYTLEVFLKAHL